MGPVTYRGAMQSHTTSTKVAVELQGTTTMTQTSHTVLSIMETRVQTIESQVAQQKEIQARMDTRLLSVEGHTRTISQNITQLMAHLNIPTTSQQKRKNDAIASCHKRPTDTAQPQRSVQRGRESPSFHTLSPTTCPCTSQGIPHNGGHQSEMSPPTPQRPLLQY